MLLLTVTKKYITHIKLGSLFIIFLIQKKWKKKKYNNPERNIHIYLFIPKLLKSAIGNALKKKKIKKNNTS